MNEQSLRDAYGRLTSAIQCEERGEEREAYRLYLATLSFISSSLFQAGIEGGMTSKKLLDLAGMCVESAGRVMKKELDKPPPETQTLDLPAAVVTDSPGTPSVSHGPGTTQQEIPGALPGEPLEEDLLEMISTLPDVPANKPGQKYRAPPKRSQTLPSLPKPPVTPPPPPKSSTLSPQHPSQRPTQPPNRRLSPTPGQHPSPPPSQQPSPRRASQPQPPGDQYFNAPIGANLGGTLSNPVVFCVSPVERARQQNALLAAQFSRRRGGVLRPSDRLELARRQQENLQIATGLEAALARKAEQRRIRLEQEEAEGAEAATTAAPVCTFEGILLAKMDQVRVLRQAVKDYDVQHKTWPEGQDLEEKANTILNWCLKEPDHPLNRAVGEAQFNFFQRLTVLDKKMYLSSAAEREAHRPGVTAELEMISGDVTNYFRNIYTVLLGCYPPLSKLTEEGQDAVAERLASAFYRPFLKVLIKLYASTYEEDHQLYREYLTRNSELCVGDFPDIKDTFRVDYSVPIATLRQLPDSQIPQQKLALLLQTHEQITESVKKHHLASGLSDEKACELSLMGADDLLPITLFLITKANIPDLYPELLTLYGITPDEKLKGKEGYCLTNVQNAVYFLISEQREITATQSDPPSS